MAERVTFEITCPNNHGQSVEFTRDGFEEALNSGTIVFHCNTCDTNWTLDGAQIEKARKALSKAD